MGGLMVGIPWYIYIIWVYLMYVAWHPQDITTPQMGGLMVGIPWYIYIIWLGIAKTSVYVVFNVFHALKSLTG